MTQITDQIICQTIELRKKTHKSYAELAHLLLGDRNSGQALRSAIRSYELKHNITSVFVPCDKLFDDPIILSPIPTIVIADTHAPYQNKEMLENIFQFAQLYGIPRLIHAGDLIDGASYNSQAKNEKTYPIETEINHARSILYTAQRYFKEIVIMPGNHDAYYYKKEKISFTDFIRSIVMEGKYLSKLTITEYDYVYYADIAVIGHPSGYLPVAGELATQLARKYNKHVLVGHDHIRGYNTTDNGKIGLSIGMCAVPERFFYKQRSLTTFPESDVGFAYISNNKIMSYDESLVGTVITNDIEI